MSDQKPLAGEPLPVAVTVGAIVPLEVFALRYALAVLGVFKGNKTKAAEALGMSRHALGRMLKRGTELGLVKRCA